MTAVLGAFFCQRSLHGHSALYYSLAGPYDVLLGKSSTDDKDYLLHHRFFYDLPEFQTVLISEFNHDFSFILIRQGFNIFTVCEAYFELHELELSIY